MIRKLKDLILKYYDILAYLFFGVLTTLVNFAVFYPLHNLFGVSQTLSNIPAWILSVLFAYLTNTPLVFKSHDWSAKTVFPELAKFVGCRVGSGALETLILFVSEVLGWNGNIMKLIASVLVVILNYVGSKLLVFRGKKG